MLRIDDCSSRLWISVVTWLLCIVLILMLIAGLRPYASYSNEWVNFNSVEQHTEFGHYGLASGKLPRQISDALLLKTVVISMSAALFEAPDNRFQVLAQIDSPGSSDPLIIGQWQSRFIVMSGRDYRNEYGLSRVSEDLSATMESFAAIQVVLEPDMTKLVVDGISMAYGPAISFSKLPTRISIGNTPDGTHGWAGSLQLFQLQSTILEDNTVRYQFNKNDLPNVKSDDTVNLIVPEPGRFPDRVWIRAMRIDQLLHSNAKDVVINLLGFVPFGFLVCLFLCLGKKRYFCLASYVLPTIMLTTFTGLALSLAIELLQSYLPGRNPHLHDLILNTLGATIGAWSVHVLHKFALIKVSGEHNCLLSRAPKSIQ